MPTRGTEIEYIPIFDGNLSFKEQLVAMIVEKILCEKDAEPLPKEAVIGYNESEVPKSSDVPGLCEGVI